MLPVLRLLLNELQQPLRHTYIFDQNAKCNNLINNYWMRLSMIAIIRDLKQIGTAGADTAAGSKFPPNETLRMYVGCIQP